MRRAETSRSVPVLVAAAMLARDDSELGRASELAETTRDRQLVVLAQTHLRGDADLLDVLVRDHLAVHPDHLLAAWIAGRPTTARTRPRPHETPETSS